ncbi:MAG: hypothetical protein ACYTXI_41030 [Nostoc sp.]
MQPQQRWTQQQKLELLDWHPMFTGRCPQCGASFDRNYTSRVHWGMALRKAQKLVSSRSQPPGWECI